MSEPPVLPSVTPPSGSSALFESYGDYVWNTLRRLGVAASDVEDLTHDVFLHVHRHFDSFDPGKPVRPWLFGFAFRVAAQHRRRAYHHREKSGEPDATAAPGALPDQALAAADDRRLVVRALDGMNLERRAVFVLYEIDGVSIDAIAELQGVPVNTVYSRLRRARAEFAAEVRRLKLRKGAR